jgi:hypothetical protein
MMGPTARLIEEKKPGRVDPPHDRGRDRSGVRRRTSGACMDNSSDAGSFPIDLVVNGTISAPARFARGKAVTPVVTTSFGKKRPSVRAGSRPLRFRKSWSALWNLAIAGESATS